MTAMRGILFATQIALVILLQASSARALREETATFITEPEFARVSIDGKYVGDTPLTLEFPCGQISDRRYRIEHDGCEPAEGILNARVGPGRIVGAAFSVGISLIFSCPRYFVPVRVRLDCGSEPRETPVPVEMLPTPSNLRHERRKERAATDSDEEILSRLRTIKDLHNRGVLSEREYQSERERLLQLLDQ